MSTIKTAARMIGEPSANNTADTSLVAANADGSVLERLEYLQTQQASQAVATGVGTEFWVKKTLTSSAITQAGVDVTGASSGGALTIADVVLQTDATGLAAGTNLTLETNNTNGVAVFFSTAVSGLGANKTINIDTASVTKIRTVLESGKKITAKMTAADGTGAGTVDVYLKFQRHSSGATVAAA